ncbi:MAG: hypothetical protein AB7O62_23800 [Pirellulales bacterium]
MSGGFMGIGPMELILAAGCLGIPLIVVVVVLCVVAANKKSSGGSEHLALKQASRGGRLLDCLGA